MGQINEGFTFSGVLEALDPHMSVLSHPGQQGEETSAPFFYQQGQDSWSLDMRPWTRHLIYRYLFSYLLTVQTL